MADNTTLNPGALGDTLGTDDIGGIKFQRVKLVFGPDGVNRGDVEQANALPVQIATPSAQYAAISSVQAIAASTTVLTLFATTSSRVGVCIWNDSASRLYAKIGQGASTTLFSFKIAPYGYWEMPMNGWGGAISGIWEAATGSAYCSQWSFS